MRQTLQQSAQVLITGNYFGPYIAAPAICDLIGQALYDCDLFVILKRQFIYGLSMSGSTNASQAGK
jgi:hypothetical protein